MKIYLKLKKLYTIEKDIDCKIIKDFDVQKLNDVINKNKNGFNKEDDYENTAKKIVKVPFDKEKTKFSQDAINSNKFESGSEIIKNDDKKN